MIILKIVNENIFIAKFVDVTADNLTKLLSTNFEIIKNPTIYLELSNTYKLFTFS